MAENKFMPIQLIYTILSNYKNELGDSFNHYQNHCCRVFNYAVLLSKANEEEQNQLAIATAFHDIGIWTANTFDYLEPSIQLAQKYLAENNLAQWNAPVAEIIGNHHKLSAYKKNTLAENFRKADLIDLSFGIFKFGLSSKQIAETKKRYASLGFQRFIFKTMLKNAIKHPFNPLPIVKW